jgi:hypothetical protein
MLATAPKIGFDRFIDLQWIVAAIKVRAGECTPDELSGILDSSGISVAAKKKVRTILNRMWLEPRPELQDFADRAISIWKARPEIEVSALAWGMAIATYPFFGKVAEFVGRLTALQGDCSAAEVHRRMSEVYGEREGTYRMTNMILQSQANWGAIERVEKGRRLVRLATRAINDQEAVSWLIEAALRYQGRAMALATLQSTAVLYPFVLDQSLAYVVSKSAALELTVDASSQQFVALQAAS